MLTHSVHGRKPLRWYRVDMFSGLLKLDVDQRKCVLCGLHLQMGSRLAYLVGKWLVFPNRTYGRTWNRSKAASSVGATTEMRSYQIEQRRN